MTEPAPITAEAGPNDPSPSQPEPTDPAPSIDLARLGERLGRYQLVLRLAEGGMGVVFAARLVGSHGVERLVAIKTLRPMTSMTDRAALLREARLTARLHHKNVVATLDLGEIDDVPYVVMELIDGVSLARLRSAMTKTGENLLPDLAAFVVMQAANGLHAAHELLDPDGRPLDLVHRDVSPQNILLSTQGEVKIADFGIAKYVGREESTATGMIKGKFGYMSPEQASSGEVDRRSDVFALGIVLWEAFTGQRLFSMDTPARTILRVIEHRPKPPVELRPEIGDELSGIAMKCLEKEPNDRYPTAAALADALRHALRTRGAVDEGDLGALVTRLFGDERARIMDRIRTEPPIRESLTATSLEAVPEPSALSAVSMSTDERAKPAPPPAASRSLVYAVAALALIGGGALFWALGARGAEEKPVVPVTTPAPSASSASSAPAPPPATSPSSTSTSEPTPPPIASSPTSRPSVTPRPSAKPGPSTKPAVATPPPAASTTTKPSPPAPSSTVGQPFETL